MVQRLAQVKRRTGVKYNEMYKQLNAEQRRAVDEIEGPVMVLAGPGTGKTQVLALRVANILRQTQMDPGNILCLTFTESAASEMRKRLIGIIGEAAYYVKISTFHSFCNEVILDNGDKFVIAGSRQPLSDLERVELLRGLLDKLPGSSPLKPFGSPYLFLSDVMGAVQWLKREGISLKRLAVLIEQEAEFIDAAGAALKEFFGLKPGERGADECRGLKKELARAGKGKIARSVVWQQVMGILDCYQESSTAALGKRERSKERTRLKNELKRVYEAVERHLPRQRDLLRIYKGYEEELEKRGKYDFEDMIIKVAERFRTDDELLAKYQEQCQYILVDEYQDTNGAQNEVVRLLGGFYSNPNIFVVGDDKQSIFRFQGASLENLLSFYRFYKNSVQVISLQNNYRSQANLLRVAAGVISHNQELVGKYIPGAGVVLRAATDRPRDLIEWREFETEEEEDFFIARRAKELIKQGVDPDQIAVLFRFNKEAEGLLDIMRRLEVPVKLEAGEDILQDRTVQQILSLLRYASEGLRPEDIRESSTRLAEIMQYDWLRLEELDVWKAIDAAARIKMPLFRVVASREALDRAGVSDSGSLLELVGKLARWRRAVHNKTLAQLLDLVFRESGLSEWVVREENLLTLNNISTLFNGIKRVSQTEERITAEDFICRLETIKEHGLKITADAIQTKDAAVRLMTAHKAKGTEFEHVFLAHMADKVWGNVRDRSKIKLPYGIVAYDPVSGRENNEDERRLFFVALTRARQKAYLSYAKRGKGIREQVPSIFRQEIPPESIQNIDATESGRGAFNRLSLIRTASSDKPARGELRVWIQEKLPSYVMSVTHLNNYLECPRLFFYRNLLRMPAAKNKHMVFGTAVHNALRDLFVRYNDTAQASGGYLQKQFEYYLNREVLTDRERQDSLELGKKALHDYFSRYRSEFAKRTLLEVDFRSHGTHIDDLRLTGRVDKIELLESGSVNVVDYKTGNPDNAACYARIGGKYHRQLVFYKLLGDASPFFKYEIVSGELDFVQVSPSRNNYIKPKFIVTGGDVDELKKTIRRVWAEIKELHFWEYESGCGKCEYCTDYYSSAYPLGR